MRKMFTKKSSYSVHRWLFTCLCAISFSAWATPAESVFVDPDPLPNVTLSQNVLFQIMASEIALQKAQPGTAYQTLLDTARQTKDPRLAQRAFAIADSLLAFPEALQATQVWLQCAPNSFAAEQARIFTLARMGQLSESDLTRFEQLRKFARKNEKKHRELLENFARQIALSPLSPSQAITLIESHLGKNKPDGQIALALSELYRKNHQNDIALLLAQKAYQDLPANAKALLQYADLAYARNPKNVIEEIEKFVHKHPHNTEALLGLAKAYTKFGNFDQAVKTALEIETMAGNNPDILFLLATITQAANNQIQTQRLLKAFELNVKNNPAYTKQLYQAQNSLGWLALERKQYQDALKYANLLKNEPKYVDQVNLLKAHAYFRLEQFEQSISILKKIEKKHSNSEVLTLLASAYSNLGNWKKSHAYWEKVLKLNPNNKQVLYQTGIYAELAGKFSRAQALFRLGIEKYPSEANFYNSLGYLFLQHEIKLNEAGQLIQTALKLEPHNPMIQDSMGWWYFMNRQYEQAEVYLSMAVKTSKETEIWLHLIELYLTQNKTSQAQQYFDELKKFSAEQEQLNTFKKHWHLN